MDSKDAPAARLAIAHAHALAAELEAAGPVPAEMMATARAGRWRVEVHVLRDDGLPPGLTPCQRDIMKALKGQRCRLTTTRIIARLEEMERDGQAEVHGECTIRESLARLVREGVLSSSRRAPRGYLLLPPWR